MEASREMESLLKRIYMPSVFYFPKALFPNLSPETQKELKEYHFFEDLGIIKDNGDVGSLKTSFNALEIYKKDGVLEGNVFQFLEMKERLSGEAFRFLLDKYLSHVKTWVYAYNWLLDNFDKQIPETSKKEKVLFKYQCTILNNHLAKLNQKFQFNFNKTSTINLVDLFRRTKMHFPLINRFMIV